MRIITGTAKGTNLKTPNGLETRPTAERTKEALFSMLQFDLEGRSVLDLFAGSGQLGLEALSRGASSAVFVDRSKFAVESIRANIAKTRFEEQSSVFQCDFMDYIKRNEGRPFDLILLDPPYAQELYQPALRALLEKKMLKKTSLVVCESASENLLSGDACLERSFEIQRQRRYGTSYLTIFSLRKEDKKHDGTQNCRRTGEL